jgi:hypothetical protein
MSSLYGISGAGGSSLLTMLQNLSATSSTTSTSKASGTAQSPEDFLTSELEKQGYSGSQLSDLQSKIETAVKSLQTSNSGSVDPAKIHDTINSVLKSAGVDTDQIDADFQAQHPGGPGGPGGPPPGGSAGTSSSTTGSADDSDTSDAISSLLTKLGIDPQKFESALSSALQNVKSDGSIDLSKLFASAGTGTQVDLVA